MKYLLIVLSLATLPGCADTGEESSVPGMAVEATLVDAVVIEEFTQPPKIKMSYAPPKKEDLVVRKLIRTGTISCEVNDIDSTRKSVEAIVRELNGYISSDKESRYGSGPQVEQIIRIPADKLDQFTARFVRLARKVTSKEFSSQDVTEEFIDNEARLVTKRDLEKRYREILDRATKVIEMLEVERQLEEVRSEIESMEGRLQYLRSQVAFSTLNVSYYQVIPTSTEFAFGPRLLTSFERGWRNILYFILNLFEQWPFIIVGSGVFVIVYRWVRRRFMKPQAVTNT